MASELTIQFDELQKIVVALNELPVELWLCYEALKEHRLLDKLDEKRRAYATQK